jgi:CHRD domain
MRLRTLAALFAAGLVAVGVAVAGINGNWSEHPTGAEEVPVRDTKAQGQATFHLSSDGLSLDYRLTVANIDNAFMAHIHTAAPGVNGPIVVWLAPSTAPSTACSERGRSLRRILSARSPASRCRRSSS